MNAKEALRRHHVRGVLQPQETLTADWPTEAKAVAHAWHAYCLGLMPSGWRRIVHMHLVPVGVLRALAWWKKTGAVPRVRVDPTSARVVVRYRQGAGPSIGYWLQAQARTPQEREKEALRQRHLDRSRS